MFRFSKYSPTYVFKIHAARPSNISLVYQGLNKYWEELSWMNRYLKQLLLFSINKQIKKKKNTEHVIIQQLFNFSSIA